jgi:triosephosphate isomerase
MQDEISVGRRPIVAGNWKMHKTLGEAIELAAGIRRTLADGVSTEVVLCPPFTALKAVGDLLRDCPVRLGAQNVHAQREGAFTGEVSVAMLRDVGCRYVIVGHSERRTLFGETDDEVRRKARAAIDADLRPIVCLGETLEDREAGRTEEVLRRQVAGSLAGLGKDLARAVVAYEPVWAIGTGKTASPDQVQQAHALLRERIRSAEGDEVAAAIRIQYGGSVKPSNAAELFALPDVDGGLIGGASLSVDSFVAIVRAAV